MANVGTEVIAPLPPPVQTPTGHNYGRQTFRVYTVKQLDELTARAGHSASDRLAIRAVATVLPFRANSYVVDELIDWSAAPDDPIYRLVFPQPDMLPARDIAHITDLLQRDAPKAEIEAAARAVRMRLNPHPGGQLQLNIPESLEGIQHKYEDTALFFPKEGQTCHAYCTYCFRWAQFVGESDLKMATDEISSLCDYMLSHPKISSVLFTGGDPMILSPSVLRRYMQPLLKLPQLDSIRIGTKSLAYWPQKFVSDPDADEMLRLFSQVVKSGKSLAFMAHFSHPRELETPMVREAVRRIRDTGAVIRTQAPLIRTINDDPDVWSSMWRTQHRLGMIPYYMFVERDTGPQDYFAVPLAQAYEIFRSAYSTVSGLARTVRGPCMSATPGKVCVDGVADIGGERVFAMHFIRCRDPQLVNRPFFAKFDPAAVWLDDLKPAFGAAEFDFERTYPTDNETPCTH